MADSDPISDASPSGKKRKLINGYTGAKVWNSEDDSGDDLFEDEHETIATLPVKRAADGFQKTQQTVLPRASEFSSAQNFSYSSQPTQLPQTQPTQVLVGRTSSPPTNIQVERSSPEMPPPIARSVLSRPNTLLASAMAPRGTTLRRPVEVKKVSQTPIDVDSDSDPPVEHSSDEESRGITSNIKPTQFVRAGRDVDSSPARVIQESPRKEPPPSVFSTFISNYRNEAGGDGMASAYGSVSRPARPPPPKTPSSSAARHVLPKSPYQTLDDIPDYKTRQDIKRMHMIVSPHIPISRCYDALRRKHGDVNDACALIFQEDNEKPPQNEVDDLAPTPYKAAVGPKGIAHSITHSSLVSSSQQTAKPSARQDVRAPVRTIAEKYGTQVRKPSQSQAVSESQEDVVKPRGRLLKGVRKRSTSPPSEPVGQRIARRAPIINIDDDDDDDASVQEQEAEEPSSTFAQRVLAIFNKGSLQELVELSAQPEEDVQFVISKRPFRNLDQVRAVSNAQGKSRKRPIGEKIVDNCEQMLSGYEAVDSLVTQCGEIAAPIQQALKNWGINGQGNGELQVMKLDEAHDSGIGTPTSTDSHEVGSKRASKTTFLAQPSNMNTDITMKDYQLVGLNWLHLLYGLRLSCILADDMGLGKTCQIISFLAQLQLEGFDDVSLIVVPGSTLENWLRELSIFAPSLRVVPYYGPQNERPDLQEHIQDSINDIDVIVTTYDMAVKDWKFMRRLEPSICIYDEAHALRNPDSDRYDKLVKIKADFKVLLTGTPLQNNLKELIAILAFIMPDLFREKREDLEFIFKHKATTKDTDAAALLAAERILRARSMITPFILRRKKVQVLDLPKKHSRVEYCDMTESQLELYDGIRGQVERIFQERENGKKATAKTSSNVIMAMRKAAIHPLLERRIYTDKKIDKIVTLLARNDEFKDNPTDRIRKYLTGEAAQSLTGNDFSLHQFCEERPYLEKYALKNDEWMDSGKVVQFMKILKEFAKNKDKVLVFSQFTMMMDILESVLQTSNIKYMRLDGSTMMNVRQDMIDQFNEDEGITVFMLSTKAGGAGINLASANKVIIFDSGFNPQDDIQAENRAHRVGQTREVEVIRLITRDTIEEQIHALGESKLELDSRVAGEGATAADDKAAEKAGAAAVEQMLMTDMKQKKVEHDDGPDLKDAYKKGLQDSGLHVE